MANSIHEDIKKRITKDYVVISPAYGRDYKSSRDAAAAFTSGVDFRMESIQFGGAYCSIRDFAPGVKVEVRYNKLQRVVIVEAKHDHLTV